MGQVPGNEVSSPAGGYTRKEHRERGWVSARTKSIHPSLTFHRRDRGRTPLWRYWIDSRMLSSDVQEASYGIWSGYGITMVGIYGDSSTTRWIFLFLFFFHINETLILYSFLNLHNALHKRKKERKIWHTWKSHPIIQLKIFPPQ